MERAALSRLGEDFGARLGDTLDAYDALVQREGDGALAQLSRLVETQEEMALLCLAMGPALERGLRQTHRALDPDADHLTAGLLLDLASTVDTHRMLLAGALHPDAALRRSGVLITPTREGVEARTRIDVAPSVLCAFRGEAIPVPPGIDLIVDQGRSSVAGAVLDALALPPPHPGKLTILTGASPTKRQAAVRIMAVAAHASLWLASDSTSLSGLGDDGWVAYMRDATLARAAFACDFGDGPAPNTLRAARRGLQQSGRWALGTAHTVNVPHGLGDRIAVLDCAGVDDGARLDAARQIVATSDVIGEGLARCLLDLGVA